ncbi:hypothetical protein PXH67_43025 (plasmid) [Streptomyces sp. P8-A8]|uniref:hypothetical protein n=1 Tax=Streptomyces sp. P8-A8 TaxID=3029759 RepID=UPI0036DE7E73
MSGLEYAIGLVLALVSLGAVVATPFLLVHSRTEHDHGPGCWWCHPHLPRRRRSR